MSDTETTDLLQLLPFEDFSKSEMRSHLKDYHDRYTEEKTNIARLTEMHTRLHDPDYIVGYRSQPPIKIPHEHVPITLMSPEGMSRELITSLERPLNATERKAMTDLVNNDFAALKAEIMKFGGDIVATRTREIRDEWATKSSRVEEFRSRAYEIYRHTNAELGNLSAEADKAGITMSEHRVSEYRPDAEVQGLKEALKRVTEESRNETSRALLTLERQRLTALRQVLLSCISAEGLKMLGKVPTAKQLMTEAALEITS